MGLDISAYRQLKAAPDAKMEDGCPVDWQHIVHLRTDYTEKHFPGRSEGLAPGVYSFAERHDFRGGSYSGYGMWRDELAKFAGYPQAEESEFGRTHSAGAWAADGGPFWELIHFFDCDGVIGPVVAAKLAKDFAEHQERANSFGDDYWRQKYSAWRVAFEMAADSGAVEFH